MEFIKEPISERQIKSKQTDLEIPQGGVLRVTLFLIAINGILKELGDGADGSLFAEDLAIYIYIIYIVYICICLCAVLSFA